MLRRRLAAGSHIIERARSFTGFSATGFSYNVEPQRIGRAIMPEN